MTRTRLAPIIAVVVGLTFVPLAGVHAETAKTRDPAQDVVRITRQHPAVSDPDPAVAFGDLTADGFSMDRNASTASCTSVG